MAEFEEILAELQREGESPSVQPRPVARVTTPADAGQHAEPVYGGMHLEFDAASLRAQGYLAPDSEQRVLADEYRHIKRPLISNANSVSDRVLERGNLLMVTSALAGEGKTFTCVNLCLSIAREQDWSVVLIDGDCNRPLLSRFFGAEEQPGLMELLRDTSLTFDDLVMPTDVPGFSVLSAGKRDEHSAELFASARMEALCAGMAASDSRRIVVFDSSPLLLTTEAPILASHVGQIVMVVQASHTPQQAVLAALERLDQSKAINLILNQAAERDSVLGYGAYDGYGE